MNRISKHIIVAFSAVVTLVSCAKEPAAVPEGSGLLPQGQTREIAVSFGESTKSVLGTTVDDTYHKYKPAFCVGDKIKVSNATRSEDCVVADDGGVLKIFTNLAGDLKAVYPASVANVTGTAPIPETDPWFKISTTQSGKFSDANICTATIDADDTAVSFENQTALLRFYVDESIGVQKITITGTADIATEGSNKKVITVDPDGTALISTVTEEPDKRLCYVAILPGTNTLTFESVTTAQGQGTVSRTMKSGFNYTINKIYNAFIPYYIKIKVSSSPDVYQKWAYCNVGAFLPEEAGRYFMWGETVGQVPTGATFSFPGTKYYTADNSTWEAGKGFSWENCPWTNGTYSESNKNVFTKYTPSSTYAKSSVDNKTVLDLVDDAAYVNWGKNWRMFTKAESDALCGLTKEWKTNYNNLGVNGYLFTDGNSNSIFLLATSYGAELNLSEKGVSGDYWTSSLVTDTPMDAYTLQFTNSSAQSTLCHRYYARCIRPIYDPAYGSEFNPYTDEGNI